MYVIHPLYFEHAMKIMDSGRLLSPVLARGMSVMELQKEKRNVLEAHISDDLKDKVHFIKTKNP